MGRYINTKLGYANQNVQLSFTQFSYDSSIEKLESILNSFIPEKDELYTQLFNSNTSSITTSLDNKKTQEKNLTKLSEHSDTLKEFCPLKVPKTHNIKAEYKRAGYYMLSFRWKRGEYEYNARWHTRTPNAPKEQENTWVIERTLKGKSTIDLLSDYIVFDIEKESGVEVVGETKVKIAIEEDEEPWDDIDDELTDKDLEEIDKINSDFIK